MEFTNLGQTGVKVSRVCLGTMSFTKSLGADRASSERILDLALDSGINFIDCANVYGNGSCEQLLGEVLQERRGRVVLTSKFRLPVGEGPNEEGASRLHIMQQVERSLRNLRTDHIDLYLIHKPDPHTPISETLRALEDLVRQGKVRYIGCSNFDAWRILESLWVSDRMNLERFAVNQPRYNLLNRSIEAEILPACRAYRISTMCASPLAEGWLAGSFLPNRLEKSNRQTLFDLTSEASRQKMEQTLQLEALAKELGITMAQLALAWLLCRGSDIIPILGASRPFQLEANLPALRVKLPEEALRRIDAISPSPYSDRSLPAKTL